MQKGLLDFLSVWLSSAWELLTTVKIPGTDLTPGIVLIGVFVAVFDLRLLGRAFGFSFHPEGYAQGGGNNAKIHVSKNRKDDEH